jgi:hypothetical protein
MKPFIFEKLYQYNIAWPLKIISISIRNGKV